MNAKQTEVWGLLPAEWDALGVIVTMAALIAAAVAAVIAARQLRQSHQARLDQARPYVMLTAERTPSHFSLMDLHLQNVGAGPAHDVRIDVNPPLRRAQEVKEAPLESVRVLTRPIAMLPPGFSLNWYFDSGVDRAEADLPKSHEVRIWYHDGHGNRWDERHTLELDVFDDLLFSETLGVHHVAKSLREVEKSLKQQNEHLKNPIAVTTEPREGYEAKQRAQHEARLAQIAARREEEKRHQAASQEGNASTPSSESPPNAPG
jgi:hypothetical protein